MDDGVRQFWLVQVARHAAVAMGVETYDNMIKLFTHEAAIKRPNTVEEVAAVAVLLASDAARNITGCLFPVDGGTMPY